MHAAFCRLAQTLQCQPCAPSWEWLPLEAIENIAGHLNNLPDLHRLRALAAARLFGRQWRRAGGGAVRRTRVRS